MAHQSQLIGQEIHAYLASHERKTLLRLITCGSVDDGKSSLIGRLLYDSKLVYEDQLAAVTADSVKVGTTGDRPDLALLMDGLQSEREQGITIDVAYRYFSTERRKFIIADTPGHEQYTRNMATGASTADAAVILVDARKGVLTQTRRHSYIVSLLGIRQLVLAVNKMDLVDYEPEVFERIARDYRAFAARLGVDAIHCVPLSALDGDNVVHASARTPWYDGPPLLELLETLEPVGTSDQAPLRLPVQWVNRPHLNFRGFSGTIAGGRVRAGDPVVVLPSGKRSRVRAIVTYNGEPAEAGAGEAVTLTLDDEIDIGRGDLIVHPERRPAVCDQFRAHLVWMHETAMLPNRQYLLKTGTQLLPARVSRLHHRVDVNSLEQQPANALQLNEIGYCSVTLDHNIAFDRYADNRQTGAFILIDRLCNATVGAGMIDEAETRSGNVVPFAPKVTKAARAELKGQRPCIVWFTGLSGAGKSTLANALEQALLARGHHSYLLDANNLRHGINSDLGFSDADRVENLRRAGEIARLFVDGGLIVLASFISPYRQERQSIRSAVAADEFIEVFVDTPLERCIARDPNRLYARARAGEIPGFTGIDAPYERPVAAELTIDGAHQTVAEAVAEILALLRARGVIH